MLEVSQTKIYQELATALQARYSETDSRTKTARGRVDVDFLPWTITVGVSESPNVDGRSFYTRLNAPFVEATEKPFNFQIYRDDFFGWIGKVFGMQDIKIGDAQFDKDFIIQGNMSEKVEALLQNKKIKQILSTQEHFHFRISQKQSEQGEKMPEGLSMLSFKVGGVITDVEQLKTLVELFKLTLNQINEIGLSIREIPAYAV